MQKHLALILIATIALPICEAGAAETSEDVNADSWDLGAHFGGAFMQDMIVGYPGQDRPPYEFEYDPGWAGALTVHYRFDAHWRVELELGARQHELGGSSPDGAEADGELTSRHIMTNIYFNFRELGDLQPYAGLGFGRVWGEFEDYRVDGALLIDDSAHAWSWQLIVGVRFAYGEQWSITTDYRFMRSGELKVADMEGSLMDPDLRSHALSIGIHRSF